MTLEEVDLRYLDWWLMRSGFWGEEVDYPNAHTILLEGVCL